MASFSPAINKPSVKHIFIENPRSFIDPTVIILHLFHRARIQPTPKILNRISPILNISKVCSILLTSAVQSSRQRSKVRFPRLITSDRSSLFPSLVPSRLSSFSPLRSRNRRALGDSFLFQFFFHPRWPRDLRRRSSVRAARTPPGSSPGDNEKKRSYGWTETRGRENESRGERDSGVSDWKQCVTRTLLGIPPRKCPSGNAKRARY